MGRQRQGKVFPNVSILLYPLFGKRYNKQWYSSVFGIKIKSHSSSVRWNIY